MGNQAPTAADLAAKVDTAITAYLTSPTDEGRERITRAVRHIAEALCNLTHEAHRLRIAFAEAEAQLKRLRFALAHSPKDKSAKLHAKRAKRRGLAS